MSRRGGAQTNVTIPASTLGHALPGNTRRRYLRINDVQGNAITVYFGPGAASSLGGIRIASQQPDVEFRYADIGDLIQAAVSVYNGSTTSSAVTFIEGFED